MAGMTEEKAAVIIQGLFRTRLARKNLNLAILSTFEKVLDESTGLYFYYNSNTGQSTWEKPKLLDASIDVKTPRSRASYARFIEKKERGQAKTAKNMDEETAAKLIQGLYRTRVARKQIKELSRAVYERLYDPESGNFYYYNSRTGETTWEKPKLLGKEDFMPNDSEDVNEGETAMVETTVTKARHRGTISKTESIDDFLLEHDMMYLKEILEEEEFDDMEALSGITKKDAFEIGLKTIDVTKLFAKLKEYRKIHNWPEENDDSDIEDNKSVSERSQILQLVEDGVANQNMMIQRQISKAVSSASGAQSELDEEDEESDFEYDIGDESGDDDGNSVDLNKPILGVKAEILFPGDGEHYPQKGEFARVHYTASLQDGTVFESSRKRGRAFEFLVGAGHVIRGWDLAVRKMSRGERTKLIIEPEMAYGKVGRKPTVPPDARLTFEVELIDIYEADVGEL